MYAFAHSISYTVHSDTHTMPYTNTYTMHHTILHYATANTHYIYVVSQLTVAPV